MGFSLHNGCALYGTFKWLWCHMCLFELTKTMNSWFSNISKLGDHGFISIKIEMKDLEF
jgi:hypothetical protein